VALCRRDAQERIDAARIAPLADDAAREEFFLLAAHHRVSGLVLLNLVGSGHLETLEDSVNETCRKQLQHLRWRAASLELERDHLAGVLARAEAAPMVLKGAALTAAVYTEPVERDLADLDFLVPRERLRAAVRAVLGQGYEPPGLPRAMWNYRRHHFHIPLEKSGMFRVEIHWALNRATALSRLDTDAFLGRPIRLHSSSRQPLDIPQPEQMILHFVLQSCYERFNRLSRFVDIDRIIATYTELNWDSLVAAAREANLLSATALSLEVSRQVFHTRVPDEVIAELRPTALVRTHIAITRPLHLLLEQAVGEGGATGRLLRLWLLGGTRDRLQFLKMLLMPECVFPLDEEVPGPISRGLQIV